MTDTLTTYAPPTLTWHATDADDRFPGRFTAHYARAVFPNGETYHAHVTPGDAGTYDAPGWHAYIRATDCPAPGVWTEDAPTLAAIMTAVESAISTDATDAAYAQWEVDA